MAKFSQQDDPETYAIIGACFEVHNVQGGGLAEQIYQESVEVELSLRRIPFRPQPPLAVYYKGVILKTSYRPDLFAFESLVVELKACDAICDGHRAQLLNYMRSAKLTKGLLINFSPDKVEYERFVI